MVTHVLKTWPIYFQAVFDGTKTFELRKNDRSYRVGDILKLREWDPELESFTGSEIDVEVTYILFLGDMGLDDGYCAMGIRNADSNR